MKTKLIVTLLLLASPILISTSIAYAALDLKSFTPLNKPTDIVWTGDGLIASREGGTSLVMISADGKALKPFASSFTATGEVHLAVSHGKAGFPSGHVYAVSGKTVYQIDSSGGEVKTFSTPSDKADISFLTFDNVGRWGYLLYAVSSDGLVWSINSDGKPNLVVSIGEGLPRGITVAPTEFGKFGGDLIVTLAKGRKVLAISHEDPKRATVIMEFKEETPEAVLPIPSNSDLYLVKQSENAIVTTPSYQISPYAGGIVVITKGGAGEQGSITVLKTQGDVISITKLAENLVNPSFGGAAFAPTDIAQRTTVTAVTTLTTVVQGTAFTDYAVIGVMAIALLVLAAVFMRTQSRRKETQQSTST